MNFKKSFFGYFNFILGTLFSCIYVIVLAFLNLEYINFDIDYLSEIFNNKAVTVTIAAVFISVILLCIFYCMLFYANKLKKVIIDVADVSLLEKIKEISGNIICLLLFIIGLIKRINICISASVNAMMNTINGASDFFDKSVYEFENPGNFYEKLLSLLYRFTGIKSSVYVWFNFVLQILVILLLFMVIRNLFSEYVAILPMLYFCISKPVIDLIIHDGETNLLLFVSLLCMYVFIMVMKVLFRNKEKGFLCNLLVSLGVLFSAFILPVILKDELALLGSFSFGELHSLVDPLSFLPIDLLMVLIFTNIFVGCVSYVFLDSDNISALNLLTVCGFVFFFFGKTSWPGSIAYPLILITYSGLGIYNMLLNFNDVRADEEFVEKKEKPVKAKKEKKAKKEDLGTFNPNDIFVPEVALNDVENENNSDLNTSGNSAAKDSAVKKEKAVKEKKVKEKPIKEKPVKEKKNRKNKGVPNQDLQEEKISIVVHKPAILEIDKQIEQREEINENKEKTDVVLEVSNNDNNVVKNKANENISVADKETEKTVALSLDKVSESEANEVETEEVRTEEVKPSEVKLIDNPVAMPKKHTKKEISYKYDTPSELMKFDIEISDNDDFDI